MKNNLLVELLNDDVLLHIFQCYLGPGHFAFVALTSKDFYRLYKKVVDKAVDANSTNRKIIIGSDNNNENNNDSIIIQKTTTTTSTTATTTITTMKSIIESIPRCKFYLSECNTEEHEDSSNIIIPGLSWLIFSNRKQKDDGDDDDDDDESTTELNLIPKRQHKLIQLAKGAIRYGNYDVFDYAMLELDPSLLKNHSNRWILYNAASHLMPTQSSSSHRQEQQQEATTSPPRSTSSNSVVVSMAA